MGTPSATGSNAIRIKAQARSAVAVAILCLLASATAFFTVVSAATAQTGFEFLGSIKGSDTPAGESNPEGLGFGQEGPYGENGPAAIRVDQASGRIYVADPVRDLIIVLDSSGQYLSQIAGSTIGTLSIGAFGIDNSGGPTAGYLFVADAEDDVVHIVTPAGAHVGELNGEDTPAQSFEDPGGIAVDPSGAVYVSDSGHSVVDKFVPAGAVVADSDYIGQFSNPEVAGPNSISFDAANNLYVGTGGPFYKFEADGDFVGQFSVPYYTAGSDSNLETDELLLADMYNVRSIDPAGNVLATAPGGAVRGVALNEGTRRIYVSQGGYWIDVYKRLDLPDATTDPATEVKDKTASVSGSLDLGRGGPVNTCEVQFGTDTSYGRTAPCDQDGPFSGPTDVTAHLTDLVPGVTYHYRIAATNAEGTGVGNDQTFTTFQPPTIEAVSSSNVLDGSADLNAKINPQKSSTTYRFDYGPTPEYGSSVPIPDADLGSGATAESVTHHIEGLEPTTYHFRVVATNEFGTVFSDDQTFDFFAPNCPNSHIRQVTGAAYLPDCRAYELVSPANAAGTLLFASDGPSSGEATHPSRIAFSGLISVIPGAGDAPNAISDLYVSTRRPAGWTTKYVGRRADEAYFMGGPPPTRTIYSQDIQTGVLTDPELNEFVQWDNGTELFLDLQRPDHPPSLAPWISNFEGELLDRLPSGPQSDLEAENALNCKVDKPCQGHVAGSKDLSKFFFSTQYPYLAGGRTDAPGSAYANDVDGGSTEIISRKPGGENIAQDPGSTGVEETIDFPASSTDGSRVVMSVSREGGSHLYMRVEGLVLYDISTTYPVTFTGSTPDASRVYFTSPDQMTGDDEDSSVDLFMWDQPSDEITRVSTGANDAGNSDACVPSWTQKCNVTQIYLERWSDRKGGQGGNGVTDSAVADNGDIYFYSPELLDGDRGFRNEENVYAYRNGRVQYVTTLAGGPQCIEEEHQFTTCSEGPMLRMQITPDGKKMAFLTRSRLTSYDNVGLPEMYLYDAELKTVSCVSCRPDGLPPTAEVQGSQNGLFLTDDGRTFFSTKDALVPHDTNGYKDVYEYSKGRPQLISSGLGERRLEGGSNGPGLTFVEPGLVGVSADGTDAYFSTYEKLVSHDENGGELRIYDARTNGGFPVPELEERCAAADECHGPASAVPSLPNIGTTAALGGGGNIAAGKAGKRCKRAKKACKKRSKRRGLRSKRGRAR